MKYVIPSLNQEVVLCVIKIKIRGSWLHFVLSFVNVIRDWHQECRHFEKVGLLTEISTLKLQESALWCNDSKMAEGKWHIGIYTNVNSHISTPTCLNHETYIWHIQSRCEPIYNTVRTIFTTKHNWSKLGRHGADDGIISLMVTLVLAQFCMFICL